VAFKRRQRQFLGTSSGHGMMELGIDGLMEESCEGESERLCFSIAAILVGFVHVV
jgi:hypothetical protein